MAILTFKVRHAGDVISVPFQNPQISSAVAIRWDSKDWYNPLVLPDEATASPVRVRHNGTNYALSFGVPLIMAVDSYLGYTWNSAPEIFFCNGSSIEHLGTLPKANDWSAYTLAIPDNQNHIFLYDYANHEKFDFYENVPFKVWCTPFRNPWNGEDEEDLIWRKKATMAEVEAYTQWCEAGNNSSDWRTGDAEEDEPNYEFQGYEYLDQDFRTDSLLLASNIDRQGNRFDLVGKYRAGDLRAEVFNKFIGEEDDFETFLEMILRQPLYPVNHELELRSVEILKNGVTVQSIDLSTFFADNFLEDITLPTHLRTTVTNEYIEEMYNRDYEIFGDLRFDGFLEVRNAFIEDESDWHFLLIGGATIYAGEIGSITPTRYEVLEGSGYQFINDADGGIQYCNDITGREAAFYFGSKGNYTMYNRIRGRKFDFEAPETEQKTGWLDEDIWTYPDLDKIKFPLPEGYYYTASILPEELRTPSECYYPPDPSRPDYLPYEWCNPSAFLYKFFSPNGDKIFEIIAPASAQFIVTGMNSTYLFSMKPTTNQWSNSPEAGSIVAAANFAGFLTWSNDDFSNISYLSAGVYSYKNGVWTCLADGFCLNERLRPLADFSDWQNYLRDIEVAQSEIKPKEFWRNVDWG